MAEKTNAGGGEGREGWKRQSDEYLPLDESLNCSSSALDDVLPKY
jgi:hypothetical protein